MSASSPDSARRPALTLDEVTSTEDIRIPSDPLERVIGQEKAVEIARQIVQMQEIRESTSQQLLAVVSEHGARLAINQKPARVHSNQGNANRRLLENGAEAHLGRFDLAAVLLLSLKGFLSGA